MRFVDLLAWLLRRVSAPGDVGLEVRSWLSRERRFNNEIRLTTLFMFRHGHRIIRSVLSMDVSSFPVQ